ncbi:TetR/AcrR family transcriptional regulator [Rhodococcus sp. NPDC054953]
MTEERTRARRDPEGRRRAIVEAAADLVVDGGLPELTHRHVAQRAGVPLGSTTYYFTSLDALGCEALTLLRDRAAADLREIADQLAAAGPTPATVGRILFEYVSNTDRVRADAATYAAALHQDSLRELAATWFEGLVEVLSVHTGRDAAVALAVFTDGAATHALLHDTPLSEPFLAAAAAALLRIEEHDDE